MAGEIATVTRHEHHRYEVCVSPPLLANINHIVRPFLRGFIVIISSKEPDVPFQIREMQFTAFV